MTITARDAAILDILQRDSDISLSDLGEKVHLSPSACSRRVTHLREMGYIGRNVALLNRNKIGLPVTIFVEVVTHGHSEEWTSKFRQAIIDIPEIVEAYRLTGTIDYILKIILPAVEHYDAVYKELIRRVEICHVSAFISMETLKQCDALPLELLHKMA